MAALVRFRRFALLAPALAATALLLPLIAIAAYGKVWMGSADGPGEMVIFGPRGADLLTAHWSGVYADAANQGGPFELIPFGVAHLLHVSGTAGWTLFFVLVMAGLLAAVLAADVAAVPGWNGRSRMATMLLIGSGALLTGLIGRSVDVGHPAEVMSPVLWLLAAAAAKQRRYAAVGVLLALSMGWETWGVLGAPVVFCGVERPRLIRAGAAGVAVVALIYGPFLLSGHFAMFSFAWPVARTTLVHRLAPGLVTFPWTLRVGQAVVAMGAGVLVARLLRSSPHGVWLAPLAIVAVRLTLDPCLYGYYWIAPAVVVLGGVATATRLRDPALLAASALAFLWLTRPAHDVNDTFVLIGYSGAITVIACMRNRRGTNRRGLVVTTPELPPAANVTVPVSV